MNVDRKQILASVFETIQSFSSKEYQKRVWICGEGPEVEDFDEAVCNFFQDANGVIQDYKKFGLNAQQYEILAQFRDLIDAFCKGTALSYHMPENFIDTPEWEKIMNSAKDVLKAFNYQTQ